MSSQDLARVIRRIANEIVEHNKGTENMILVGIHRRGVYLARRIQKIIEDNFNHVSSIETSVRQFGHDVKKAVQEGVSQQELLKTIDSFIDNFNGTQVDVIKTVQ